MTKSLGVLVFLLYNALVIAKKDENATLDKDLSDVLNDYFTSLSQEGTLDFTIILSSKVYYDDGSVHHSDALAFASKAEDDTILENFNLSTVSKSNIKKLVNEAKKSGIYLSLYQETIVDEVKTSDDFGTEQKEALTTSAANVVLHPDGFVIGMEEEIRDAMDLTDNVASIQVLEYFDEGQIKRNTTTSVYSNRVNVLDSYKMSPRMVQTAEELLRKAYKVDMDDRSTFISQLFEKEYPRYDWKVFANSTAPETKKNVAITLATGHDKYNIVGVSKAKSSGD